ncbi:DUF6458 family protein [Ornithinicoccus halotolerans]|uniref:DUF6458 family protein n=1 Tax=Ornithinicoccus halotolerans TaxID=1748220 RepID=UPI0012971855|nr:DUF6458 family protein [Ornithinicoccus halotolerans]
MGLGLGIGLIVIGAILAFGLSPEQFDIFNINIIGYILMGGGVLSIILGMVLNQQRANTTHREVVDRHDDVDRRDRRVD